MECMRAPCRLGFSECRRSFVMTASHLRPWQFDKARESIRCLAFPGNLEPWQTQKLSEAYQAGRRRVKVNELCNELNLDRGAVLDWFKAQEQLPENVRQSIFEARQATKQAEVERQAILNEAKEAKQRQQELEEQQTSTTGNGEGPYYTKYYEKKRLGWDVERTLENVYHMNSWPSDEMVSSIYNLHRIPRKRILQWFADRRRVDRKQQFKRDVRRSKRRDGGSQPRSLGEEGGTAGPETDAEGHPEAAERDGSGVV